jgi:hypothetical protein
MGMEADCASEISFSLASESTLSLEQQDKIDEAELMCETALELLKTDNLLHEALKTALEGLRLQVNVFGQKHIDVARSERQPRDWTSSPTRLSTLKVCTPI